MSVMNEIPDIEFFDLSDGQIWNAWLTQAKAVFIYFGKYQDAVQRHARLRSLQKKVQSDLYVAIRLKEAKAGNKTTETQLTHLVTRHPKNQTIEEQVLSAKRDMDALEVVYVSLQHRRAALEATTKMIIAKVHGAKEPKEGKDIRDILLQDNMDRVTKRANKGYRRKRSKTI